MAHAKIIRPVKLTTTFPEDIRAKLDLFLFSEVEGCVPKGAIQTFLLDRIREFFTNVPVTLPSGSTYRVPPEVAQHLGATNREPNP